MIALAVAVEPVDSPDVSRLLCGYFTEVIDRYVAPHGDHDDVDETRAADPSDHVVMLTVLLR